jgi:hypothetical protein
MEGILSLQLKLSESFFMYYLSIKGDICDTGGITMKDLKLTLLGLKLMDILGFIIIKYCEKLF